MMLYIDANLSFDKPLVLTCCYLYLANIVKKQKTFTYVKAFSLLSCVTLGYLMYFFPLQITSPLKDFPTR